MTELKTTITKDGQRYVDEPIYVMPKHEVLPGVLETSIAQAFGGKAAMPARREPILVRHERVLLRWMKPDGKGGLVPRDGG